jgi:two-component system, chemotaxis family, CheB/CheR fusion protein
MTSPRPSLVVAVGAPPGAVERLGELLAAIPKRGWTVVVVAPDLDEAMADRMVEKAPLTVVHGSLLARTTVLVADHLYLSPGAEIAMSDGLAAVSAAPGPLPIDRLLGSLAELQREAVVGVVLMDPEPDGANGLEAVREVGGLAVTAGDEPMTAVVEAIARFARRIDDGEAPTPSKDLSAALASEVSDLLSAQRGFDASAYKASTLGRRVSRRMALGGHATGDDYLAHLRESPLEQMRLIDDLLIGVTDFFRDPEAFAELDEKVVRPLVAATATGDVIRVWVAGCATGEEAYTLAMIFNEAVRAEGRPLTLEMFATDVDDEAIAIARRARYPQASAARIPPDLLERYFEATPNVSYQVRTELRSQISFALHDLVRTAPFSGMHLVSCRNVLIYLAPDAQDHVLRMLHFAIQPQGHLFLGSSESTGREQRLFEAVSKRWRIFRRREAERAPRLGSSNVLPRRRLTPPRDRPRVTTSELARRAVLRAIVPATIVVSDQNDILFMHGELRPYLRFPDGEPQLDLNAMVASDLATRVRAALFKCRRGEGIVEVEARSAEGVATRVTATPATELGSGAVIVSFEKIDATPAAAPLEPPHSRAEESLVDQLERELRATQEDLQQTVEELETANEALVAANEEASSMNEELQSANEELEATTEELRSVNEELSNVNVELREKVEQVERGHDDLANFFASTHIATLFLDEDLAIKRYTPAAAELLRLSSHDIGRHVDDIARELLQVGLVDDARWVLNHLAPRSTEIRTAAGRWTIRRVLPYRTELRRVEGVVVTLVDVTDLKQATERLAVREQQQAVIARLGLEALEEPDLQQFMGRAVREIQQVLGTDYCKLLELQPDGTQLLLRAGVGWREGLVGEATVPADLESHAGFTLKGQTPVFVNDFAEEKRFSSSELLREHGVTSGLSCVVRGGRVPYGVIGVHTRARRHFTEEDANFLVAMATVIAAAIGRDQTTKRLSIEGAVAQVLSRASRRSDVIAGIYQAFAGHFEAGVGELWIPLDGETIHAAEVFTSAGFDEREVRERFCSRHLHGGDGFIARVWQRGTAEWVTSFRALTDFSRREEAQALGLASGLAFPLLAAGEVTGVFSVFSTQLIFADEPLLRSLEGMGRSIGEALHRLETQARAKNLEERAAEALRRGEERYRNLFEAAGVSLWEKDFSAVVGLIEKLRAEGVTDFRRHFDRHPDLVERALDLVGIRDVNERTVELLGARAKKDLLGSLRITFMPETLGLFVEELVALAEGRTLVSGTTVRRTLQGTPVDVAVTIRFPSPPGPYDRVTASLTDITPIKRAQAKIEESQRWFNRLADATPDAVAVYDVDHDHFAWANRETGEILRCLLPDDDLEARAFYRSVAEGSATAASDRIHVVDEGRRWLQIRAVPFGVVDQGRLVLIVARDVTDLKQTEKRLLEANQQKDDFLAMLGHELRNPLAAVRNASELLRLAPGDARVERVQKVLDRQTRHMAKLIDGLLDVSRIIRGKIQLARETVDLSAVVRDLVDDYRERFRQREVGLVLQSEGERLTVVGDRVRLVQIADNLLSNALKFTPPPGTVTVRLMREGEDAVLEVEDTGVGIEPPLMGSIFQTFFQAEQTIDRSIGGLGLGLALVKGLVELHEGTVTAASEGRGRGTRFTVRLPIRALAEQPAEPVPKSEAPPLRVLVVEDHADASALFAQILEHDGHQVRLAHDGHDAVAIAPRFRPHVVLCDIGLPGMSGLDVARVLRRNSQRMMLVAVSGYGRSEDVDRSLEAGFDAHLSKPVSIAAIRRILAEAAERGSSRPADDD